MSHTKNVPSINVVTSETSTGPIQTPPQTDSLTLSPVSPTSGGQGHSRSPSDPKFLSAPSPVLPTCSRQKTRPHLLHFPPPLSISKLLPTSADAVLVMVSAVYKQSNSMAEKILPPVSKLSLSPTMPVPVCQYLPLPRSLLPHQQGPPMGKGDGNDAPPTCCSH
jgi:hypothetical protein